MGSVEIPPEVKKIHHVTGEIWEISLLMFSVKL